MRNGKPSIRLWTSYAIPVGLELQPLLAVDALVNPDSFVGHISTGRVDDDVVLAKRPVARLNTVWADLGDGRVHERHVRAVKRLEPAQVESRALGSQRFGQHSLQHKPSTHDSRESEHLGIRQEPFA